MVMSPQSEPVFSLGTMAISLSNWAFFFLTLFLPQQWAHNLTIIFKTLPRDLKIGVLSIFTLIRTYLDRKRNVTTLSRFKEIVCSNPNKRCIVFEDQEWTFRQVDEYSNKVARFFRQSGFKKGDVVGVFMTCRAEYPCIWLGLAKIGVVSALINSNLTSKPLIHSIQTASCKALIFSEDLKSAVLDINSELSTTVTFFQHGKSEPSKGITSLNDAIENTPSNALLITGINYNDHLVYIYTSGTTGLPKAAIVTHSRFLSMSTFCGTLIGLRSDDIVYNPLPLYHSAGGLLGIGSAILIGATVVLRKKFSASNYITDCVKHECTVAQYIGEICRYVLAVPEKLTDKQHKLRMIIGNGLRPAIWHEFVKRFNINKVMELYGATEGNILLVNTDNKIGAVGSIPRFFPFKKLIGSIIRVNADTMEAIRGDDGLCIECEIDEPGMFIGIIPHKESVKEFHGYLDKNESKKKYIYDVFTKGDKAFMSGDLIMMDELGYIYFKDRTGDTFRWKGENVATSEVECTISTIIGLKDCIVYGVKIGDLEGRAGMAAIAEPSGRLDFDKFTCLLNASLPLYAHPQFIRLMPELEMTGTFKLKKVSLAENGFNPSVVTDPLFYRKGSTYELLTKEIYEQIISGNIHF